MITSPIPPPDDYEPDGVKRPHPGYEPPFPRFYCERLRQAIKDMGGYKATAQRLGLDERALRDATEGRELVKTIRDQLTQVINGS